MFAKILIPLDGSKIAEQSLPYAAEIARAFASEVTLLGVVESGGTDQTDGQHAVDNGREILKKLLTGTGVNIFTAVKSGNPARKIQEYTVSENIDLIVMTGYGRSGIGPWPLGGTIHKVLHLKSPVPIIVIRPFNEKVFPDRLFDRIMVPLDGSMRGEASLPYVIEIARHFNVDVTLFRSIETETKVFGGFSGQFKIHFEDQDVENARKTAEAYLHDVAGRFSGTKATVNTIIRTGEAADEIIKLTNAQGFCLIAMSSHGHSGIDAWMYGSVTEKMINAGKKSLLLVRSIET